MKNQVNVYCSTDYIDILMSECVEQLHFKFSEVSWQFQEDILQIYILHNRINISLSLNIKELTFDKDIDKSKIIKIISEAIK